MARILELKVPPPVVTLVCGMLMAILARSLPWFDVAIALRVPLAWAFVLAGIALNVASALQLRRKRTTVNPMRPARASSLVDGGVYRFSRNPIYLGDALMLAGWTIWLANLASLAGIPLFIAYMNRFQVEPEERALRSLFGDQYDAYRSRVRRWI